MDNDKHDNQVMCLSDDTGLGPYLYSTNDRQQDIPDSFVEPLPPACYLPPPSLPDPDRGGGHFRGSTGTARVLTSSYVVSLMFYGRRVVCSPQEFRDNAGTFRNRVVAEADCLARGAQDWYNFHARTRKDQPVVSRLSHWFSGSTLPDLAPLKQLVDDIQSIRKKIAGMDPVDADELLRAGTELQELRIREKSISDRLNGKMQKAANSADTTAQVLSITEEVSFGVLKHCNKLYSVGNPFRQALGEMALLGVRGAATGAGNYLAYKDAKHVYRALQAMVVRDFPPILVNLVMDVFAKYTKAYDVGPTRVAKKAVEAFIRANLAFVLDLLVQAIEDTKKIDDDWVINKLVSHSEAALMDMVSVLMRLDRKPPPPLVRKVTFILLSAVIDNVTATLLEVRKRARDEKQSFGDTLVSSIPALLIAILKSIVEEFLKLAIDAKFDRPEKIEAIWKDSKKKSREALKRIKEAAEISVEDPPKAAAKKLTVENIAVRPKADVPEIDPELAKVAPREKLTEPAPHPKEADDTDGEFKGLGPRQKSRAEEVTGESVLAQLREKILAGSYKGRSGQSPDDFINETIAQYQAASGSRITMEPAAEGNVYYRLVPKGSQKGWRPYYITKQQLEAARQFPDSVVHVLLALPAQNWAPEYEVQKVAARKDTVVFRSKVAATREGNVYQLGGELVLYRTDANGKRITVSGEQIIIPHDQDFNWIRSDSADKDLEPIKVPGFEDRFIKAVRSDDQ